MDRTTDIINAASKVWGALELDDEHRMDATQAVLALIMAPEEASTVVDMADELWPTPLAAVISDGLNAGVLDLRCGHGELINQCEATH